VTATALLLAGCGLAALGTPGTASRRLSALAVARREDLAGPPAPGGLLGAVRADRRLVGAAIVGALSSVAWLLAGPVPAVLLALCGLVARRCLQWLAAERDADRAELELLAMVGALAEEYQAGATVSAAFAAASATAGRYREPMRHAASLASDGADVTPALASDAGLAPLAVACAAAGRNGLSLAAVLDGVRADLLSDRQTRRAVRTALTGPRTSALLLATLPAVGLLMGAAMGANPQRVLLHTPAGLGALAAGAALDVAGVVWTLLLTRRALA